MITLPKLLGGLGVRDSQVANTTLLGKMIWDILHSPEKHWVHVLKEKYLRGGGFYILLVGLKLGSSYIWRSFLKAWDNLQEGFQTCFGDGQSSLCYSD